MLRSGFQKEIALVGFDGSGADAKGLGDLRTSASAQLYQRQQDSQLSLRQLVCARDDLG